MTNKASQYPLTIKKKETRSQRMHDSLILNLIKEEDYKGNLDQLIKGFLLSTRIKVIRLLVTEQSQGICIINDISVETLAEN